MHGTVPEGALCALMGQSGSGKSTLLDLLTGRKDYGRCEGEVLYKGSSIANQQEAYISQSGYMRQVNTGYLEGLTVLENLVYAAILRFPGTIEEQSRRVQTAMEQASLERSAHTRACSLSGGQKRRLKVALELLVDRQILFLDEPTSGLDATASLELVVLLKRLSRKVTLVVAIHQPRPEVWNLFSHVILLSAGRTVYCGRADNALAATTSMFGMKSIVAEEGSNNEDVDNKALNSTDSIGMDQKSPTFALIQDTTIGGERGQPDPTPPDRSIPDTILDRLALIGMEHAGQHQGNEATENEPCGKGGGRAENTEMISSSAPTAISGGSVCRNGESRRNSVFKVAAILLTRSYRNGYAKDLVLSSVVLVIAVTFIAVSLRVASDESMMLHLVISVLGVSMLPVLLVYAPVMLISAYDAWPLTKLEIADGFYSPWCATVHYLIDHFAAAVFLSFAVVSIAHFAFWSDFISALPAFGPGVILQLSCAFTLTGWVTISLFDSLLISGLSFGVACGISNAFNTIWAVFSGTILIMKSIPLVLKAVTYSSPHYWATFFGLRVLLDGLDLTASCDYETQAYCATSYGDVVASALDLHIHTTAQSAVCLAAMAAAGLASLAAMVHFKGRHTPIIGGVREHRSFVQRACRRSRRSLGPALKQNHRLIASP